MKLLLGTLQVENATVDKLAQIAKAEVEGDLHIDHRAVGADMPTKIIASTANDRAAKIAQIR